LTTPTRLGRARIWHAEAVVDDLVGDWLSLPQLAERIGEPVSRVRQWLRDGRIVGIRRGDPPEVCVPSAFERDGALLKGLTGTLTLLRDCGYSAEEAVRWMFTDDAALSGRPVDALAAGRPVEVHRRAQALGF
jgi:hypothetical protein